MATATAHYISPPAYAKRLGVDPSKILGWIRRGELKAFNTAANQNGRPRWKISADAIIEFESRRSATPTPKATRRKRRKQDSNFIRYF